MDLKEIQAEELKILKCFKKYCEKHKLRFFLEGGTLIGAVRHHGFIPWDDDIDTIMPREDYEKLIELEKTDKIEDNLYIITDESNEGFRFPYLKICNKKTKLFEDGIEQTGGIFIDVFPIDGAANNVGKIRRQYRFMDWVKILENYAWMSPEECYSFSILKKVRAFICRSLGTEFFKKWLHQIFTRYKCGSTRYVSQIAWSTKFVYSETESYLSPINLKFEDDYFPCPSCYHERLTQMYGNYMEIPAEEKRNSKHKITAEWKMEA